MKRRIFIVMICAVMMLSLCGCGGGAEVAPKYPRKAMAMLLSTDGSLVYCRSDGQTVNIERMEEYSRIGVVAPDEKHILLYGGDKISIVDGQGLGEEIVTSQEGCKLLKVYNQSAIYCVEEGEGRQYYLYTYQNGKNTALGGTAISQWASGEQNGSVLLAFEDGSLSAFDEKGKQHQLEAPGNELSRPIGISNDAKQCAWKKEDRVFYFDGKTVEQYDTAIGEELRLKAYFNPKEDLMIIVNAYEGSLLFKKKGKPPQIVTFEDEIDVSNFVVGTKNGNLMQKQEGEETALYVSGVTKDDESQRILFYVTAEGEKQIVLEFGAVYSIQNGRIYYINREDVLCSATLDGANIRDIQEIDEDVFSISPSVDGSLVCYSKNVNRQYVGDLYCAKWGEKGTFVDSDVSTRAIYVELEGDSFVYLKEPYTIQKEEGSQILGMLMWANPSGSMRMLTKDCAGVSPEYMVANAGVKAFKKGQLKFFRYDGYQENGGLICDYCRLNDKLEVKTAKEQIMLF